MRPRHDTGLADGGDSLRQRRACHSSHLQAAPGGGTYVSGISQPALGISAPLQPHLHIIVYGRKGDILAEETDTLNRSALTVNHYFPASPAPYTIYLPVDESRIGKIIISSHSGHHHPEAKNSRFLEFFLRDFPCCGNSLITMKRTLFIFALAVSLAPGLLRAQDTQLDEYVAVSTALAQDNLDSAKAAATKLAQEKGSLSVSASQVAAGHLHRRCSRKLSHAQCRGGETRLRPARILRIQLSHGRSRLGTKEQGCAKPLHGKQMSSCGSIKGSPAPAKMGGCCG